MTHGPDPHTTTNTLVGAAFGSVVQANTIQGGLHQYHQHAARPVVSLPHRAGLVPPRAASFQHRDASPLVTGVLDQGDTVVLTSDGAPTTDVLSGLGGVGKTQLAVDYAEHLWTAQDIDLLVWISAGSRETVVSSYARLAADLTGVENTDPEQGARCWKRPACSIPTGFPPTCSSHRRCWNC